MPNHKSYQKKECKTVQTCTDKKLDKKHKKHGLNIFRHHTRSSSSSSCESKKSYHESCSDKSVSSDKKYIHQSQKTCEIPKIHKIVCPALPEFYQKCIRPVCQIIKPLEQAYTPVNCKDSTSKYSLNNSNVLKETSRPIFKKIYHDQKPCEPVCPVPKVACKHVCEPKPLIKKECKSKYESICVEKKSYKPVSQQKVVVCKPDYQQQQQVCKPVCVPKPVCHEQQVCKPVCVPKPVCHEQQYCKPVCVPKPICHEQQYCKPVCVPKPICHEQQYCKPVCVPKPVCHEQQYCKPVCVPKPVCHEQQVCKPVCVPKSVCHEQQVCKPVCVPKPVCYEQQYCKPVCEPKPVCHEQIYCKPVCQDIEVVCKPVCEPKPDIEKECKPCPTPICQEQQICKPVQKLVCEPKCQVIEKSNLCEDISLASTNSDHIVCLSTSISKY